MDAILQIVNIMLTLEWSRYVILKFRNVIQQQNDVINSENIYFNSFQDKNDVYLTTRITSIPNSHAEKKKKNSKRTTKKMVKTHIKKNQRGNYWTRDESEI